MKEMSAPAVQTMKPHELVTQQLHPGEVQFQELLQVSLCICLQFSFLPQVVKIEQVSSC